MVSAILTSTEKRRSTAAGDPELGGVICGAPGASLGCVSWRCHRRGSRADECVQSPGDAALVIGIARKYDAQDRPVIAADWMGADGDLELTFGPVVH